MQGLSPRVRRQFVPYLHLVPIRIGEENVRLSRNEFAPVLDLPARALDGGHGFIDIARGRQTEPEVLDATGGSDVVGALFEHEGVAGAWGLRLDEMPFPIDSQHPEHVVVELERSLGIAHDHREMSKSKSLYHRQSLQR